jgi:hypothetical protein
MFLKIENPGVAPVEGFYLLGATTKNSDDENTIGQFGSGNKHAVALCLRHNMDPVVFCGLLRLSFSTKPVGGVFGQRQMVCRFDGKDENGNQIHRTVELSQCAEYGEKDWKGIPMAMREFISNAIDEAVSYNSRELRETTYPWDGVKIETVEDNQVRAKAGTTRVFVPLTEGVLKFYTELGKWFLHFSEPHFIKQTILPKRNRNLGEKQTAVFFRRGVRVREIEYPETESLFDYNLNHLEIDECRKMSDWSAKYAASQAMQQAPADCLAQILSSLLTDRSYWEHGLDADYMSPNRWGNKADNDAYAARFSEALACLGDDVVITGKEHADLVTRKGYRPLVVPDNYVRVAEAVGVRTGSKVLTTDEKNNRQILPATAEVLAVVDELWGTIVWAAMNNGKEKPPVKCFAKIMDCGALPLGKYEDGVVLINADLGGEQSQLLRATVLEELAHHITQATDNSRDLQDWAFNFACKMQQVAFV